MRPDRPEDYTIEAGPMGPIGEGEALILRVNRNCPWNRCLFCDVYKSTTFSARSMDEIKRDIDVIHRIKDLIEASSSELGSNGRATTEAIRLTVMNHSEIYGAYPFHISQGQLCALRSLQNVANWLMNGGERVFLQDANALAMKPADLIHVLHYLNEVFPGIETITSYARSKTCAKKSFEELSELQTAGLSWCFVGIESGCDEILEYMKKGVTRKEQIQGGQKATAARLQVAAFVMPGLCGDDAAMSHKHITDTIEVLNEMRPTEVRVRSLAVLERAPLYERYVSGEFKPATEDQLIEEIRRLVEGLDFDCSFETLQMTNPLFAVKGQLSQIRSILIQEIEQYKRLPLIERARFVFSRYVDQGYLDCVKAWGRFDSGLKHLIEDAKSSLSERSEDAMRKTERAIFAIKAKGVP